MSLSVKLWTITYVAEYYLFIKYKHIELHIKIHRQVNPHQVKFLYSIKINQIFSYSKLNYYFSILCRYFVETTFFIYIFFNYKY